MDQAVILEGLRIAKSVLEAERRSLIECCSHIRVVDDEIEVIPDTLEPEAAKAVAEEFDPAIAAVEAALARLLAPKAVADDDPHKTFVGDYDNGRGQRLGFEIRALSFDDAEEALAQIGATGVIAGELVEAGEGWIAQVGRA